MSATFGIVVVTLTITITFAALFGVGVLFATIAAEEGFQHKEINCWNASYAGGRANCTVMSWQQLQFWAQISSYQYNARLQVTFASGNNSNITLLAPSGFDGALPDWLITGNKIDCYFSQKPASLECLNNGFSAQNIWIGDPPTDMSRDASKRSFGIGMACFMFSLAILLLVLVVFMVKIKKE